ncbi:MAG: thermonuclease family protein [Xanthobacteraceae bacterium]|nr:thermonuclease family protein [Xanthobacteraceae bacterium]QYK46035.1 MAG: thermonuclease family protein [Xanthobacteraceae bacterium]
MTFRKVAPWLFVLAIALGVVIWSLFFDRVERTDKDGRGIVVQDGDSFIIDQTTIRLEGIDAPEIKQNCMSGDGSFWRCGRDAQAFLSKLLRKGDVRCQPRAKDRYGRTIATCSARDTADVAEALVRAGWAINAAKIGEGKYAAAEAEAKEAKRGIWQGPFERPSVYRFNHPREDVPKQ